MTKQNVNIIKDIIPPSSSFISTFNPPSRPFIHHKEMILTTSFPKAGQTGKPKGGGQYSFSWSMIISTIDLPIFLSFMNIFTLPFLVFKRKITKTTVVALNLSTLKYMCVCMCVYVLSNAL